MTGELLTPDELRALSRARLSLRRPRGPFPGGHLAGRTGTSLEFADHRPYEPGDDVRLIDWAVYARHRRLVTKVFAREVEAPLYLLLDASRSMGEGGKADFARKLAAALLYVAHRGGDRFAVYPFRTEATSAGSPRRGRGALAQAFQGLAATKAEGETDLAGSLVAWAEAGREPGLCIVISDFLAPGGYRDGLLALRHGRHAVLAVQVLSRADLDPPRLGEVRLLDVETRRARSLVLGPGALRAYREALRRWNERLAATCRELRILYFLFRSDASPVEAVLTVLEGWRG
ncbi:MAG: DUF58 domain-containing protein [Candidatus Bipolaricaulota bacterium]|nr:DUF58 domain-containing protein [Candidatus Bipolaricaulota bacterium]